MLAVRVTVHGWPAAAVGIPLGTGVYLTALWGYGLDPRDRLVVRTLADAYRQKLAG